ncbi:MAG TPA: ferredoxin-thioredoxin reductase catalytic domain-containing protein [Methanoregulaceae archaeon]|nr:ferredoxin-thioredoxin reductase catalytic domain-containing protein [Methanoregulaceae archaeon]
MTVKDPENEEEMRAWAEAEAESNGIRLNPDERQLAVVLRGLVRNRERFGERYCPCRIRTGDPEKDQQIICPCIFRDEELKADGRCHCNLFFTKE